MIKLKYFLPYFIFACLISSTSYLTVSTNIPTIYSPFSLISALPILIFPFGVISFLLMPIIYLIWSFPLIKGQKKIPIRTDVISIILVILSFIYLVMGWRYGIRYQGIQHVISMYIFNIVLWLILLTINIMNKRLPSFTSNLLFHGILFIWLSWIAFPWLGELI